MAAVAGVVCQPWQSLVVDDILAERADGRWACREAGLEVPRQNGKSVVAEVLILAGLFLLAEELIVYTAHQVPTAKEIFLRLVRRVEDAPDLYRRVVKISHARGDEGIELQNPRQRLIVRARSKESVRGFSADRIILDEAQLGLDVDEMAALGPTQRTRPNPQTLYMGTPPLGPGTFWGKVRRRALAAGPNDRIGWHEWSPKKPYDREDPAVWRATNPSIASGLITEEAVAHDLNTLGVRFDAEGLGAWPDEPEDGWLVIPQQEWEDACNPQSAAVGPIAMCFDANPTRTWASVAVAGARADGLLHVEVVDRRPGVTWLTDRVVELHRRWQPAVWVIDQTGPAGSMVAEVEQQLGIEVAKMSRPDQGRACGRLFDGVAGELVDKRDVRWTGHPEFAAALSAAVKGALKRDLGDGAWAWHRMSSEVDISPLVAVTGALHGWATAPAAPQAFFASWR